jgi:4-amino-4-deoxy-L-arabinose transferase-like glycosyltransferase
MVTSGNWLTLQLHGSKFWAKPPLSIWATAGAMRLLGTNEFGSRISHFIFSLAVLWLIYFMASRQHDRDRGLLAAFILMSSVLFFVSSGAVMTDASLNLGTTLSMVSFWLAIGSDSGRKNLVWGYLFFLGLSISLLAKGPVGLVLTFMPVFLWVLWTKKWQPVISRIPWGSGITLMAALTLPWFIAAEFSTPGFLKYYIIGEHWLRFTQTGWSGDLYGSAHSHARGTIWLYWVLAALPWSIIGPVFLAKNMKMRHSINRLLSSGQGWTAYLLVWALTPMIFFTLAGNILWTYVLPCMPAFALLLADFFCRAELHSEQRINMRLRPVVNWIIAGIFIPVVFAFLVLLYPQVAQQKSQKIISASYLELQSDPSGKLVYLNDLPFSAEFYTGGNAVKAGNQGELSSFTGNEANDCFALQEKMVSGLETTITENLSRIGSFGALTLFCEKNSIAPSLLSLKGTSGQTHHQATTF